MAEGAEPKGKRLVVHTVLSRSDLVSIYHYNFSAYGEEHAEKYISFIEAQLRSIASTPYVGVKVEEIEGVLAFTVKSSRRKSAHGYRVFYRITREGIEVLRILHTRMDWPRRITSTQT